MGIAVIADAEWYEDKIYCFVCRNANNPTEYQVFDINNNFKGLEDYAKTVDIWIGHNFLESDLPCLAANFPSIHIDPTTVIDTLVASRLFNFKFKGGHSVENYAERFSLRELPTENEYGIVYPKELLKIQIEDWSVYTKDILDRCISDTLIQYYIYNYLKKWIYLPFFKNALRTEHYLSTFCLSLHNNGFPFDIEKAKGIKEELDGRLGILDTELTKAFPPKHTLVNTIRPRLTKHGTIHAVDYKRVIASGYSESDVSVDKEYPIYETQEFNPGSLKQIIERLNDAGWKPTERTAGHQDAVKEFGRRSNKSLSDVDRKRLANFHTYGWKLTDSNLRTLPPEAPQAAQRLVERLLIASRVSDLEEYLGLVRPSTGAIHGKFFHIGSWTQRMSHANPNMANIPIPQHKDNPSALDELSDHYNAEIRKCFVASPGNVLVGTDADGIQMRVFAHYVNDERLTNALVRGSKKDGTDIHTVHWNALKPYCKGRNPAKTFIYAWLLGAGKGKVAEILECGFSEAGGAVEQFIGFYPGLQTLKDDIIPKDAARGYFIGLDKRLVICDNTHLMLAGYLQNGEKVIMSKAVTIWEPELIRRKVPYIARDFVHDEWQTETRPEYAEEVGRIQADSIRLAGEALGLNCPLAGNFKIGSNWNLTH